MHLLLRLETARHGLTLQQLADDLPPDLLRHPRTMRRDLQALESLNIPLVTERVNGEVRWRLLEGFRNVPALRLSPTELMSLTFSRQLLTPLEGTGIQASLESALGKAASAIPPEAMNLVRQLERSFSVGLGPHKRYRHHRHAIDVLTRSITQKHTVQMRYYSASRNMTARREVDPYRLRYVDGGLYLIGYCHLRKDVRMFAVERIRSLSPTDHPYQMPLHFDLESYVEDALVVMRGERVQVELVFDKATAAWVRDRVWHPSQKFKRGKKGTLSMILQVANTRELLGWILSFGAGVSVVQPKELREAVLREARKILETNSEHSSDPTE
jgi:predicted DNA-binding transcriptional regulator YafY